MIIITFIEPPPLVVSAKRPHFCMDLVKLCILMSSWCCTLGFFLIKLIFQNFMAHVFSSHSMKICSHSYSKHLFSLITPLRKGPSCRARTSTCGLITAIGLTCPCTKELTYALIFSVLAAHEPSSNMTIYVSS